MDLIDFQYAPLTYILFVFNNEHGKISDTSKYILFRDYKRYAGPPQSILGRQDCHDSGHITATAAAFYYAIWPVLPLVAALIRSYKIWIL